MRPTTKDRIFEDLKNDRVTTTLGLLGILQNDTARIVDRLWRRLSSPDLEEIHLWLDYREKIEQAISFILERWIPGHNKNELNGD